MNRDLPKHYSYAPCRKKGPYIYFVKDGSRVTMPGRYPLDPDWIDRNVAIIFEAVLAFHVVNSLVDLPWREECLGWKFGILF